MKRANVSLGSSPTGWGSTLARWGGRVDGADSRSLCSLRCGLRGKPGPTTRTRIENLVEVAPWLKWTHGKRRRTASEQSELHLIHYIAKPLLTSESSGLRLCIRAGF